MAFLGKIVHIDLTIRQVEESEFDAALAGRFLAGRGFNSLRLWKGLPGPVDPFGPDNTLYLTCGLLTGTEAPASSRLHVSALSPLTGLLGSSNVGGHFGAALRAAGIQGLAITGASDSPACLAITPAGVEIVDAPEMWGLDAWESQDALRREMGSDNARVLAIGPGGEEMVRYGCIMTERGHAAGRTGMGAVMGSKRLKAIGVSTDPRPSSGDSRVRAASARYARAIRDAERYPIYSKYSNTGFVTWADETGILATRNYQRNQFEGASRIDGMSLMDYVTRSSGCYRCPVHCKAEVRIESGPFAGLEGERPDIEPIVALGSKCRVDDPEAVLHLYNLCGRLGIDAISAAGSLAFAMELREVGLLTRADTDGLELVWGNHRAMGEMLGRIAHREGFGRILAEGVARAAREIGGGAEAYAHHSKGLEVTAYDPRGAMGTALGYAVSGRGADFTTVHALPEYRWDAGQSELAYGDPLATDQHSIHGKAALVKHTMSVSATLDSLGLCKVAALNVTDDFSLRAEAELTSVVSGIEMTPDELLLAGERVLNLERLFNMARGATRADDRLPERFLREGLPDGPARGATVELEQMLDAFYAAMGWDAGGRPADETLSRLDLL